MTELLVFGSALLATYIGVKAFRRWSLQWGMLDVPNDRSSHESPTPRGGGLIVVVVSLFFYVIITYFLTNNFRWTYMIAACLVASISWLDDLYSVSFFLRLCVHSVAAAILIWGVGFSHDIYIPALSTSVDVGRAASVIAFLWIVWMVNAYNFMDGIDGLAASQAIVAGFAWLIAGYIFRSRSIYLFGGILAFSSIGFLIHNWSPAKIFMGDVGSAFLGFTFAAIPMIAATEEPEKSPLVFFAGVSFVWFFLFDTVFTFFRRAFRREKVWQAHRGHLYQNIATRKSSHSYVTLLYAAFTAVVSGSVLIGILFRGSWELLSLFTIVLLSAGLIIYGFKKMD